MPALQFPTRPTLRDDETPAPMGEPVEAKPCRGHHPLMHDDTCVWCGHLPPETIRGTWERRAKQVVKG